MIALVAKQSVIYNQTYLLIVLGNILLMLSYRCFVIYLFIIFLYINTGDEHISFTTSKIGSLVDVNQSRDPDGLRYTHALLYPFLNSVTDPDPYL